MKQLDRNSDFVRIRLDIPRLTYEHFMELVKLSKSQLITDNPDVVAASCIDATYYLLFKEVDKNGRE